jgi:hypothetical protein
VLVVSALKLGNPMVFGVDMVVDNLSLHAGRESLHRRRCRRGAGALARIEGVETSRRPQSESLRAPAQAQRRPLWKKRSGRDDKSLVDLCQ